MKLITVALTSIVMTGCALFQSDYSKLSQELKKIEGIVVEQKSDGTVIFFDAALFGFDSYRLDKQGRQTCKKVADVLVKSVTNRYLYLEGHTDNLGSDDVNQRLSYRRAETIRDCIISGGFSVERLDTVGHGSLYPKCSNNSKRGRACNRRVEIVIVKYKRDS